jgi:hypothetical protein
MEKILRISLMRFSCRIFSVCFFMVLCCAGVSTSADNDQEILNQLYQEIIHSSTAVKSIKLDTLRTLGKTIARNQEMVAPSEKISDPVSERLKKELEKIVNDAQVRHSDAIKFMQDAK